MTAIFSKFKYRIKRITMGNGVEKYMPQHKPHWFPFWLNISDRYTSHKADAIHQIEKEIEFKTRNRIVKTEVFDYEK